MAGSIRLYGGAKSRMPSLPERMPGFCTDTGELYIGTEGGNLLLASRKAAEGSFERLTLGPSSSELKANQLAADGSGLSYRGASGEARKIAFRAASVAQVSEGAGAAEIASALNRLIKALKDSGTMEE